MSFSKTNFIWAAAAIFIVHAGAYALTIVALYIGFAGGDTEFLQNGFIHTIIWLFCIAPPFAAGWRLRYDLNSLALGFLLGFVSGMVAGQLGIYALMASRGTSVNLDFAWSLVGASFPLAMYMLVAMMGGVIIGRLLASHSRSAG